jgi:hypothetical protein
MRIVYLDESGIGNIKSDPHLVVAGVIIHADAHWLKLQAHLANLLEDATPKGVPLPKALHAKDIWHGTKQFHRDLWPRELRMDLLNELARVPQDFQLHLVWGAFDRKRIRREVESLRDLGDREALLGTYTIGAMVCFIMAEEFMRRFTPPNEVASVVFEANSDLQKLIPRMYELARNPERMAPLLRTDDPHLPLTRLIDTPTFQTKTQSSILQIADFCAFAIKRFEQGAKGAEDWYARLEPRMVRVRKDSMYYAPEDVIGR